jgi:murein DD-endopeptidase MepM/ murein hydrolase activator NlpD
MAPPRHWKLLWVPLGSGTTRSIRVSQLQLRLAGLAAGLVLAAAAGFGYGVLSKALDLSRLERLERANAALAQEVVHTKSLLRTVSDTVAAIMKRDELVRLLADLPPHDPDVLQAGIGGPASPPGERELLLAGQPLGRDALSMRVDVEALIRRANLLARSFAEATDSLRAHQDRLARTPSIMPTRGWLTSNFTQARMHPIFHEARRHDGIDIAARLGTPIVAPAGGLVIDVNTGDGYGKYVSIDHGYGVITRYAHCSKILVRIGQRVRRGDEIALVGNTGLSTSPHLHYEIEVNGKTVDPRKFILRESVVD